MTRPNFSRLALVGVIALVAACQGTIGGPGGGGGGNNGNGGAGAGVGGAGNGPPVDTSCDIAAYANVTADEVLKEYSDNVHPKFLDAAQGCLSCHGTGSGRLFVVTTNASETFYRARSSGYFKDEPGSLVARLNSTDAMAKMPKGLPGWSPADIQAAGKVACMVRALDSTVVTPPDEQFPADLLNPYTGPVITNYDNTFINYLQLKAKVKSVFNDDWLRDGGVDQFAKRIDLFGGANFTTGFTEARAATADFLLGMDDLAPDVCGKAATGKTGPFAGFDFATPILDVPASSTRTFEAEAAVLSPATGAANVANNPSGWLCYNNCKLAQNLTIPSPGQYQIVVRAKAWNDNGGNGPKVAVAIGTIVSASPLQFSDGGVYEDQSATLTVPSAGANSVTVEYINNGADPVLAGGDRNIYIDRFQVVGPLGAGTGTTRETLAKTQLGTLYQRLLFRQPTTQEKDDGYLLLKDLSALGTTTNAWSGVCEALVRSPDFLFTLPPAFDTAAPTEKTSLLTVAVSQQLAGRPPTPAELAKSASAGLAAVVDDYLASPDFRNYYFSRMRLRLESRGTLSTDEPARLWTYLATTGAPFEELLTGEYSIDPSFGKIARGPEHGKTGVLTMKGYLETKPGLPHYNYPARVLSGFLGMVFEVPPEVFDQRGTATAASTVDPKSICFSCHQLLTPLAHQRLKWDDTGEYRTVDEDGKVIDDTDRGLVAGYPYKGAGLESFSTKAVKKEAFIRRMISTQFKLLMGRDLRHDQDERDLYKALWDLKIASGGDLKAITRAIAASKEFKRGAP